MAGDEWTHPATAQRAIDMPELNDLHSLVANAIPMFLIGDDELFGSPATQDMRNAFRLVAKAIREYDLAAEELRHYGSSEAAFGHMFIALDHFEDVLNAMHRACLLLDRLKRAEKVPLGKDDLLRPAEVDQIKRMRDAAEHVDDWVRQGKLREGEPVMLDMRCEGVIFAGERVTYPTVARWLRKLHAACLKVIQAERPET